MKNNTLSEKELDHLLNLTFLNLNFDEPKNQNIMETISNHNLANTIGHTHIFNRSFLFKSVFVLIGAGMLGTIIYYSSEKPKLQDNGDKNSSVLSKGKTDPPTIK